MFEIGGKRVVFDELGWRVGGLLTLC
jgi:hypothetical protein